jgi:hypothetical protein
VDKLNRKLVARRNFLARLGGVAVAYTFRSLASLPWAAPAAAAERVRTVSGNVTWPKGMTIRAGRRLRFNPNVSTTVTVSGGNVIVEGDLEMRPAAPGVVHTLRFTNISEATFVGGGNVAVASDRGLWVMGSGKLNVQGTPKLAWARVAGSVKAGQQSITLDRDPIGWRVGDELAITPTEPPNVAGFSVHYDHRKIAAIEGRQIMLDSGCVHPHPSVTIPASALTGFAGATYGAEVLNLTRNVRIEGTPGKRSHVFIRSSKPQHISHVELRHMGPQKNGMTVVGRWPCHFHHMDDASRGSVLEGCVVRDAGSHAFVAHRAHGITFRNCIAHNVHTAPFWWDQNFVDSTPEWQRAEFTTHDTLYEGCVASLVAATPGGEGHHRLAGFSIQIGNGNSVRGCVAVSVAPDPSNTDPVRYPDDAGHPAGFVWPSSDPGAWVFDDNLAHNIRTAGILSWINTTDLGIPIRRFTAYHCGNGIVWGAYFNRQDFEDVVLYKMSLAGVVQFSVPAQADTEKTRFNPTIWERVYIDGVRWGVMLPSAQSWLDTPIQFRKVDFRNYAEQAVYIKAVPRPLQADFTRCEWNGVAGREFALQSSENGYDLFRVREARGTITGSFNLKRSGQAGGVLVPAWNAKRYEI